MKITVDHVVLEVKDVEASARFYESLLGFPPVRLEAFLAGSAPFASARVNRETIIDLFPKAMWKGKSRPSNPNHVCFTMNKKQVDALKRRMKDGRCPSCGGSAGASAPRALPDPSISKILTA